MTKERDRELNTEYPLSESTPGRRLAALRAKLKRSQSAVARDLGSAITTLRAWEYDEALPKPEYMEKLTRYYAVSERAIRFGETPSGDDLDEPDYPAWKKFKKTAMCAALSADAYLQIKSYRWPDGTEPRDSAYSHLATGLLDAVPSGDESH